jgi:5-methylcytosine-specific restriction endonuclease McrA
MLLPGRHEMGPTVDHVVPLCRGGTHELHNLRITHWRCNCAIKKSKPAEEVKI